MTPEHERLGIHFWGEERLADIVALANLVLLPGGGMEPKTERDRQIIAAFDAGQSVEELCEIHRLAFALSSG